MTKNDAMFSGNAGNGQSGGSGGAAAALESNGGAEGRKPRGKLTLRYGAGR